MLRMLRKHDNSIYMIYNNNKDLGKEVNYAVRQIELLSNSCYLFNC